MRKLKGDVLYANEDFAGRITSKATGEVLSPEFYSYHPYNRTLTIMDDCNCRHLDFSLVVFSDINIVINSRNNNLFSYCYFELGDGCKITGLANDNIVVGGNHTSVVAGHRTTLKLGDHSDATVSSEADVILGSYSRILTGASAMIRGQKNIMATIGCESFINTAGESDIHASYRCRVVADGQQNNINALNDCSVRINQNNTLIVGSDSTIKSNGSNKITLKGGNSVVYADRDDRIVQTFPRLGQFSSMSDSKSKNIIKYRFEAFEMDHTTPILIGAKNSNWCPLAGQLFFRGIGVDSEMNDVAVFPDKYYMHTIGGTNNDNPPQADVIDGISCLILKEYSDGLVKKVRVLGDMGESFIVSDGMGNHAHGLTIEECRESLLYKISNRDTTPFKTLPVDHVFSRYEAIKFYRTVTGACERETRKFVQTKVNPEKDEFTFAEINEITNGQYGHWTLVKFLKDNALLK